MRSVKVALVQMRVTEDKERNLRSVADAVRRAAVAEVVGVVGIQRHG